MYIYIYINIYIYIYIYNPRTLCDSAPRPLEYTSIGMYIYICIEYTSIGTYIYMYVCLFIYIYIYMHIIEEQSVVYGAPPPSLF